MHWRSVPLLTKHHLHSPARTRQRQPDRIAHIKHERWLPCCVADHLWPSLLEREDCFSHLLCHLSIISALERYRGDPKDISTRPGCGHRASSFMRWKRCSQGIFMAVDSLRYLIHPRGLGLWLLARVEYQPSRSGLWEVLSVISLIFSSVGHVGDVHQPGLRGTWQSPRSRKGGRILVTAA